MGGGGGHTCNLKISQRQKDQKEELFSMKTRKTVGSPERVTGKGAVESRNWTNRQPVDLVKDREVVWVTLYLRIWRGNPETRNPQRS